jgi:DNA primase
MQDTAKYLVHADITADGVVERSDVVGAVFGQTEGLLGDELDLRELQDSSKVGRIDVDIDSQNGQSFGRITIATSLDQVETAILGAALETIDRVGPCRSTIEVRKIEDVRAAKRREVIERAKVLFGSAFDESMRSSRDLVEEVREAVRIEDIIEYQGLPAGPNVEDSDAIIIVEGRADVLTLLQYGIKNAIAVEGTDVPAAIAELTTSRTVTAFLDGDRGGELIRKELSQVGSIDHVAFAPEGRSVEDMDRHEVMAALREKVPHEEVRESDKRMQGGTDPEASAEHAETDSANNAAPDSNPVPDSDSELEPEPEPESDSATETESSDEADLTETESAESGMKPAEETAANGANAGSDDASSDDEAGVEAETLRGHVAAVIGEETGRVRLLDGEFGVLAEGDADAAFDLVVETEPVPSAVVLDAELSQRVLDVAAQRGIEHVVADSTGEFVKQPTTVRVRTADQLLAAKEA